MAKKINSEDPVNNEEQTPVTAAKKEKEIVPDAPQKEIPPQVDIVLKSLEGYAELYVDTQGGSYTPDTPLSIRGNALLYKNPYYKS